MGCSQPGHEIQAATLNFSGICLSPFEYHDSTIDKDYMSCRFQKLLASEFKDKSFTGWDNGRIDLKFQKERYTPIYRSDVGVEQGKLLDKQEFQFYWNQYFNKIDESRLKELNVTPNQVSQVRLFDWLCYLTLINFAYTDGPSHDFDLDKIKQTSPQKYMRLLKNYHSKAYLNNQKKMKMVAQLIKTSGIDVFFMQQAQVKERVTWADLLPKSEFTVVSSKGESVIIYRNSKFPGDKKDTKTCQQYDFDFNNDSTFVWVGNHLLISAHLTSKNDKNRLQGEEMFNTLNQVKSQHSDTVIIVGVDANQFLPMHKHPGFGIYPVEESTITSAKKRTYMQLQTNKANVIVMDCKDLIITTQQIVHGQVRSLGGKSNEVVLLPTDEHPFDHFLVGAKIR